jgi:hypothetical protein
MHLSVPTDNGSESWGAVPRKQRRSPRTVHGQRTAQYSPTVAAESLDLAAEVHESLEQGTAYIGTSLRQAVAQILIETPADQVLAVLGRFFKQTSPGWEFLMQARSQESGHPSLDLAGLARDAQDFYPKESGRVYVRAAIYLNADAVLLEKDGKFPALRKDWPFLGRHLMLLTACMIASENLKVSDDSTEAVARDIWGHWVRLVKETGSDFPDHVDRLIEDAYLKAAADESECDDDDEPEIWQPRKVTSGGYA